MMKLRLASPGTIIDLNAIRELGKVATVAVGGNDACVADRVLVMSDTDGDGKADRVVVFTPAAQLSDAARHYYRRGERDSGGLGD